MKGDEMQGIPADSSLASFMRALDSAGGIPSRSDCVVVTWEERDRTMIDVQANDQSLMTWWDEEAREMFELGFFEGGRELEASVLDYCVEMGWVK